MKDALEQVGNQAKDPPNRSPFEANMTKKLYVGGLHHHVTGEILDNLFSACGTVESATVTIDKITDLSRGFGFVEMSSESEAHEAMEKLDGIQFEGRTIRVYEARPRPVQRRGKVFRLDRW